MNLHATYADATLDPAFRAQVDALKLMTETLNAGLAPLPNSSDLQKLNTLNFGQCEALKVLVADRLGLSPHNVDDAQKLMRGEIVHPMIFARISHQATLVHNQLAGDAHLLVQANSVGQAVLAEYGLVAPLIAQAT